MQWSKWASLKHIRFFKSLVVKNSFDNKLNVCFIKKFSPQIYSLAIISKHVRIKVKIHLRTCNSMLYSVISLNKTSEAKQTKKYIKILLLETLRALFEYFTFVLE